MIRFYTLYFLFSLAALYFKVDAQTTSYYELTKKVINGISSTNVSGGQFISFLNDICYESDRKGIGVGHGTLKLNPINSKGNFKIYIGNSYWGNETIFKFKADLSVLNVITEIGDIYVYKKQTAPISATTCSLIHKKKYQNKNKEPSYPIYETRQNVNVLELQSAKDQHLNISNNPSVKRTCPLCHGKRRIVRNLNISLYGQNDYQVKCQECEEYFMRSTGHTHIMCPQCHGKGYFTID